jgi:two-component system, NtrC family, response regulator HupR/HoxA
LKRVLVDEPYETIFTTSGKEALEILRNNQIQVIVTDMCMPGMGGLELLRKVKQEYPHVVRIVLSGFAEKQTLLWAINQGEIFRFIPKPWKSNDIVKSVIRQAIDYYDLHSEREMLMHYVEQIMQGNEPEQINVRLIQAIISKNKKQLEEWGEKCDSVPLNI